MAALVGRALRRTGTALPARHRRLAPGSPLEALSIKRPFAGNDGTVELCDTGTRTQLGQILNGHQGPVQSVAFNPDGYTLASAGYGGRVRLWEGIAWHGLADLKTRVCSLVVGNVTKSEWETLGRPPLPQDLPG